MLQLRPAIYPSNEGFFYEKFSQKFDSFTK
jgi:hypothetical protein